LEQETAQASSPESQQAGKSVGRKARWPAGRLAGRLTVMFMEWDTTPKQERGRRRKGQGRPA
jgi:hypothetical protein